MTVQDILSSSLSDNQKLEILKVMVPTFGEGGNTSWTQLPSCTIELGGKPFVVKVATTEEQKEIGLSKAKELPRSKGMIFIYQEPEDGLVYTMADTSIDLDIIFINAQKEVTSVNPVKAFDQNPIVDRVGNCSYVVEVPIHSGVKVGDKMTDNRDYFTDEEKEIIKNSKMLVLDENGDVQMKLKGGERIFSRICTKKIIKQAIKAYRDETDQDFKKLGKIVFNELDAQDGRDPQYVQAPK